MSPLGRIGVTKISVTFPLASKIPYWLLKTVAIPSPASSQPFLPIPPLQQVARQMIYIPFVLRNHLLSGEESFRRSVIFILGINFLFL